MKKTIPALLAVTSVILMCGAPNALGGSSVTAYGTYWDTEDPGYGLGLKYGISLIDMVFADVRGGYIAFEDPADTTMVPLELSFNLGFPGPITPYAGVGMGYYVIDNPIIDNSAGYFAQLGLELTIAKIGGMAELRYMDLDGSYFDELALNIGLILKF